MCYVALVSVAACCHGMREHLMASSQCADPEHELKSRELYSFGDMVAARLSGRVIPCYMVASGGGDRGTASPAAGVSASAGVLAALRFCRDKKR